MSSADVRDILNNPVYLSYWSREDVLKRAVDTIKLMDAYRAEGLGFETGNQFGRDIERVKIVVQRIQETIRVRVRYRGPRAPRVSRVCADTILEGTPQALEMRHVLRRARCVRRMSADLV